MRREHRLNELDTVPVSNNGTAVPCYLPEGSNVPKRDRQHGQLTLLVVVRLAFVE